MCNTLTITVSLTDLRFYSHHGVFQQETDLGNEFSVDFSGQLKMNSETIESDDLRSTISYADVYSEIDSEMKNVSKLLENVAWRIIRRIGKRWPQFSKITVKITKISPPISGFIGNASVKAEWEID